MMSAVWRRAVVAPCIRHQVARVLKGKGVEFATSAAEKASPSLRDVEAVLSERYIGEVVVALQGEWKGKNGGS